MGYRELFEASLADPAAFWADAARAVNWTRAPRRILDDDRPPFYRWFPDAELNTCANALDRHIAAGYGSKPAVTWETDDGLSRTYTFKEVLDEVNAVAQVLAAHGVRRGDGAWADA